MVGVRLLRMACTIAHPAVLGTKKHARPYATVGRRTNLLAGEGLYTDGNKNLGAKGDAMEFSQVLRRCMDEAGCTGKELAQACGMSASTVSRYLAGTRTPDAGSLPAREIALALCELAQERGRTLDADKICEALLAGSRSQTPQGAGTKLTALLDAFGVTRARLAEALGYSPSYISRVCSQTRNVSNFDEFAQAAGTFFAEKALGANAQDALLALCKEAAGPDGSVVSEMDMQGEGALKALATLTSAWLQAEQDTQPQSSIEPFLRKLDTFNLDTYLAAMQAARAQEAAAGKTGEEAQKSAATEALYTFYAGVDGFCQAELDFLAAAATEPAGSSVVMFSDMPMQDKMQAKPEFPARWIAALAVLLRTGHPIDNIHNVGRGLPEMMLGLEAWLPLYMTGMVRPYYLPSQPTGPFAHLVRSSRTAALEGQAVAGAYEHVGCQLFRDEGTVAHFRQRANDLLATAKPLANVYTVQQAGELAAFLTHEAAQSGERMHVMSAPPLYTMSEELLEEAIAASTLDEAEAQRVRMARAAQLARVESELAHGETVVTISRVDESNLSAASAHLALGEAFCTHSVPYGAQTYRKHIEQTEAFAAAHPTWHLAWGPDLGFRNIQITVRPGGWVLVSKNTSPAVHFVLRHKKMVEAFEHFEMPVVK